MVIATSYNFTRFSVMFLLYLFGGIVKNCLLQADFWPLRAIAQDAPPRGGRLGMSCASGIPHHGLVVFLGCRSSAISGSKIKSNPNHIPRECRKNSTGNTVQNPIHSTSCWVSDGRVQYSNANDPRRARATVTP